MKRRRTFGGREGVWFRCKRSSSSQTEKTVVLWDDERGRPVDAPGDASTVAVSSSDEDGDDSDSTTTFRENSDDFSKEVASPEKQGQEYSQSSTGFTPKEQQQRKRVRRAAFGSRKSSSAVEEDALFADTMPHKRTRTVIEQRSQASIVGDDVSSSLDLSSQYLSSQSQVSPSKHSLRSTDTGAAGASSIQQPAPISNEKSVFDFDDISSQHSQPKGKANILQAHLNSATSLRQPTARTSLSVARAYFDQLDASSPLAQSFQKSPSHKAVAIRTRRRTQYNPELAQDYITYRQMCKEAAVPPMLLEDYVKQRENFVSRTRLYDGFLDE